MCVPCGEVLIKWFSRKLEMDRMIKQIEKADEFIFGVLGLLPFPR